MLINCSSFHFLVWVLHFRVLELILKRKNVTNIVKLFMGMQVVEVSWNRREVVDPTVYTGLLGTAFTCLRSYEVTGCHKDLLLCSEIVDTCATLARASLRYSLLFFFIWVPLLSINLSYPKKQNV